MEHTNQTRVIFLEPINTHNGAKNNDQIGSNKDSENSLSLLGIVEEDFAVGEAIDGNAGHAETDDKDDKGAEA